MSYLSYVSVNRNYHTGFIDMYMNQRMLLRRKANLWAICMTINSTMLSKWIGRNHTMVYQCYALRLGRRF